MSDITKCPGKDCTLKEDCYRFTAPVNEYRQSYFAETPKQKNGVCEEYWNNKGYAQILPKTK